MNTVSTQNVYRKLTITDTTILYGENEYNSASEALNAYIQDHDGLLVTHSRHVDDLLLGSTNLNPSIHHSVDTSVVNAQMREVSLALSDLREVKGEVNESLEKIKSVDRLIEYAQALKESRNLLQKPDADKGSSRSSHQGTDICSMATETLVNMNPYLSPKSRSRHVYSYKTARSRSLSNSRKFGRALVDEYVQDIEPKTDNISPDLLAKTAEVLTTTRAEAEAINTIDKRLNSLDDHLLNHQMKRSQSVPVRHDPKQGHPPPSWVKDLDNSTVLSCSESLPPTEFRSSERQALAQRWLAEIESETDHVIPSTPQSATSPVKAPQANCPSLSHMYEPGNLRVADIPIHPSKHSTSKYTGVSSLDIEEKNVEKMLDDLEKIKSSFDATEINVEQMQKYRKSMNPRNQKNVLSSTMNEYVDDINVLDDGDISSISQHAGTKTNSNTSPVSSRGRPKIRNNKSDTKNVSIKSGSMETLKTMLFTLQAEASAVDNGSATHLDSSENLGTAVQQAGGDLKDCISQTLMPSLVDYNFDSEPGGHSLQKALSHLNRLKSLVDKPPVPS